MRLFTLIALACLLGPGLPACSSSRNLIQAESPHPHARFSEAPIAGNFPAVTQAKLQAGQHWQAIAQDAARSLGQSLSKNQRCNPGLHPCRPIHVEEPEYTTEFSRAFVNALITALVQQGINVSQAPDAALLLHLDVQPVRFAPDRPQYRHAGLARELGPGIWALQDVTEISPRDLDKHPNPPDTLHWFRTEFAAGATPRTEIVLTLSVMDGIRYAARSTNVYYVAESDLPLYNQEICSLIRPCLEETATLDGSPIQAVRKGSLTLIGDCPLDKPCCPPGQPCPSAP